MLTLTSDPDPDHRPMVPGPSPHPHPHPHLPHPHHRAVAGDARHVTVHGREAREQLPHSQRHGAQPDPRVSGGQPAAGRAGPCAQGRQGRPRCAGRQGRQGRQRVRLRAACRLVKRDEHEVQKKESRAVQLVARPRDGVARHEIAPIRPWPTPLCLSSKFFSCTVHCQRHSTEK